MSDTSYTLNVILGDSCHSDELGKETCLKDEKNKIGMENRV